MDRPVNAADAPADEVARLLPALAHAERRYARAVALRLGLGAIDLYALGDLLTGRGVGPVELGRRLGLGSAAATGLADRLEAAGHVSRRQDPHDRRRVTLVPTERETVERFLGAVIELYDRHASEA